LRCLKTLGYAYLLVIVVQLSGWVEAFPTRKNDSKSIVKILLKELIPRYGGPEIIDSDRGAHFAAAILVQIYHALGTRQQLHTRYHRESSGQVERMNRTIKEKLVKVCKQTGLKWPEALNLVLWDIRSTPRQPVGVTPAEFYLVEFLPFQELMFWQKLAFWMEMNKSLNTFCTSRILFPRREIMLIGIKVYLLKSRYSLL